MLKTLWFLIKLIAAMALCLWLINQPGAVAFSWQGYAIETSIGVSSVIILIFLFFFAALIRFWDMVFQLPQQWQHRKDKVTFEDGNRSLSKAFTALSAGDLKTAEKQLKRARNALGDAHGLTLLCEALLTRMQGDTKTAQDKYAKLLSSKDTAFLGLRGLLQLKRQEGDLDQAIRFAREAESLYPKHGWIAKALYEMELQAANWQHALQILEKLERKSTIDKDTAGKDRAAILTAMVMENETGGKDPIDLAKRAIKEAPDFVPAAQRLIILSLESGQNSLALKTFEKIWKTNPHPSLLSLWAKLMPRNKNTQPEKSLSWFEKLIALNGQSAESYIAAAEKAIDLRLYSQARQYLREADKREPSARLYKLFAKLEEAELDNDDAAKGWLQRASEMGQGKAWVCNETGLVYDDWMPLAPPHNSFNTIQWQDPKGVNRYAPSTKLSSIDQADILLLSDR